jgi:uncharacterized protein
MPPKARKPIRTGKRSKQPGPANAPRSPRLKELLPGVPVRREVQPVTGQPLGVLVKPSSADCNLNCEYCFYHERDSDPYKGADEDPGGVATKKHRMSDETLDAFLSQWLPLAGPNPNVGWQGGEPTLAGIDFFDRVVKRQQELKDPTQTVSNALQTNGILIDAEWAQFLHEHRFLVGLSLDGPEELHDRFRFDYADKGTFGRVMRAVETMREHKTEFNLLCVVNRLTANHPEAIYEFFTREGFQWLQFIPAVERDEKGRITPFSVTPKQFGNFLCRMFDCWYQDGKPTVSVRLFDELLGIGMGQPAGSCQLHGVCGGLYVVVEYNGDIFPCDFFVEDRWKLGNVNEGLLPDMLKTDTLHRFTQIKPNASNKCESCRFQGICHNGCPHYRSLGDGKFLELDYLCEAYYAFYSHAIPKMQKLIEAQRTGNAGGGR